MSWVQLDDGFGDHPKVLKVGTTALAVHVWALCYCARHLTEGFVSLEVLTGCPWVSKRSALTRALGRLEGAGLWEREDGGFRIHDYLKYNPTAAQVLEKRRLKTERQARWRKRKERRVDAVVDASTSNGVDVPPHPAPKGAGGRTPAAPLTGARRLVEDDCMRCLKRRPLHEFMGKLWCVACVLAYSGELEDDLREHVQTLKAAM
jgi:hypothetical protein